MNKKEFIHVFEHQTLRFSDDNKFQKHHFDAMVEFNEKNNNKYFTIVYNGIRFSNHVGVIQVGGLTIEILPKADKNDDLDENLWQGVLLNMLRVCNKIKVENVSETTLKKRYNSILEVYFEMYLNEVERLIKLGLIKKYRRIQSNQLALKGKLLFAKNVQKNLIHKERFYCEHQIYDRDHLLHQILYNALLVLDSLSVNGLKDRLNRIKFEFNDFEQTKITHSHFQKLVFNRKSTPYIKAIEIAKMLILNYSPNLSSGREKMLTLLFDMNKLWEEFIYRVLQRHKPHGFLVSFQNSQIFWEQKVIRPDIVIESPEKEKFIIDTKWKIIKSNDPSDDDLKQMFAYNLNWKAEKSILLYPRTDQNDSNFGSYTYKPGIEEDNSLNKLENKCKIGFVSVVEERIMKDNKLIAQEIFEKLD